jgi:hypothetical protein
VISRFVLPVALAILMVVTGSSAYVYLARHQSRVAVAPEKPTAATPRPGVLTLPGTLYIVQSGALYSLNSGRFHQLTSESGWTQPALSPDGNILVAVKQSQYWSDVYVLNRFGKALQRITSNQARDGMVDPSLDHWSFYPRVAADDRTLWMTYDGTKCDGCFDVALAVWSMPLNATIKQGRLWTHAGDHTGGDVQPVPVPQGGVIYTKYDFNPIDNKIVGRLWYTNRALSAGKPLTDPGKDCRTPSLSPDGTQVAMVCTYEQQFAYLTVASWNGSTLGPLRTIISDQLVAQPTWAPDGSGIAYLAPGSPDGPFQLWWMPKQFYTVSPPSPTPPATPGGPHNGPLPSPTLPPPGPLAVRVQVTMNLGFDATSPIAWAS